MLYATEINVFYSDRCTAHLGYDEESLTHAEKLTDSQPNVLHGTNNRKIRKGELETTRAQQLLRWATVLPQ